MMGGATEERSGGERSPTRTAQQPKKRAETWGQDETRTLISLRRETDSLFNTSKSNKHLWDKISSLMRDKGFDRSPTMCTDKWRNLLKDFKKSHRNHHHSNSSTSFIPDSANHHTTSKGFVGGKAMSWHREIEELLRERASVGVGKGASFLGFEDKGIDDTNIPFGPMEASSRPSFNLERRLDHDGHPLSITDTVPANGNSPWNWRETPGDGEQCNSYGGRVITVKWGDYRKRIGIDGTSEAIKEAIKSAFRLRTKRAFWLEDGENIVRALDRDMPLGSYTLHLDEGLTIKVCLYEDPDQIPVHTEDKTFYNESDFHDFISRRGWTFLREYNGFRNIDSMDDLCPGAVYRGVS